MFFVICFNNPTNMLKLFYLPILCLFSLVVHSQQFSRWPSEEGLYLEFYRGNKMVGTSTGFIIRSATQNYLVTNYHCVANKLWVQKKPMYTKDNLLNGYWGSGGKGLTPTRVAIYHNSKETGKRVVKYENLVAKNGKSLWHAFKLKNGFVDAVALPLKDTLGIDIYPVEFRSSGVYAAQYPVGLLVYPTDSKPGVTDVNNTANKIYQSEKDYDAMSGSPVYLVIDNEPKFIGVFSHAASVRSNIVNGQFLEKKFALLP